MSDLHTMSGQERARRATAARVAREFAQARQIFATQRRCCRACGTPHAHPSWRDAKLCWRCGIRGVRDE